MSSVLRLTADVSRLFGPYRFPYVLLIDLSLFAIKKAEFNYTHKKQSGGAGQFGRVMGFVFLISSFSFVFVSLLRLLHTIHLPF